MSFHGFPEAALDFYDDLEIDNTKAFWEDNKDTYRSAVAEPMRALTDELAAEFGEAKLFRPYRDVRFSKDKTPYKTHQGAFVAVAGATGYYIEIGAPGVRVSSGFYDASPERLAAVRAAIDHERHGPELETILAALTKKKWIVEGATVKTAPRGWSTDHPRIALLRHKSLYVTRDYGFDDVIHGPDLVRSVRRDWRSTTDLIDWVVRNSAP